MKKIFYLSTCSTCQKIMNEMDTSEFILQDIKEENITPEELDFIASKMSGYESIFSKRAMKYRSMGLNTQDLSEQDYRKYMLQEYTFLKRPFIVDGDTITVGNSKKTIEQIIDLWGKKK